MSIENLALASDFTIWKVFLCYNFEFDLGTFIVKTFKRIIST